ncbi:hypothetical protein ABZ883_27770 [Streptomyces sp. NPDC046977]|uniref:hypothetical protein n=1 Tax=Streptomyces sp. NPDC046977 TaxID=3154703 RepID=UPI0033F32B5B
MGSSELSDQERRTLAGMERLLSTDAVLERRLRTMRLTPRDRAMDALRDRWTWRLRPRVLLVAMLVAVSLALLVATVLTWQPGFAVAFGVSWLLAVTVAFRRPGTTRPRNFRPRTG